MEFIELPESVGLGVIMESLFEADKETLLAYKQDPQLEAGCDELLRAKDIEEQLFGERFSVESVRTKLNPMGSLLERRLQVMSERLQLELERGAGNDVWIDRKRQFYRLLSEV